MIKRKEKEKGDKRVPKNGFLRVGKVHKLTKRTKLGCFPNVGDFFSIF